MVILVRDAEAVALEELQKNNPKNDVVVIQEAGSDTTQVTEEVTLSGYVKDGQSGESLIGASVFIPELNLGVTTNTSGFYSLSVPRGRYTIALIMSPMQKRLISLV